MSIFNLDASKKSKWILFAVCILGVMVQIDFTAVNVALIAIGHTVNADLSTAQWALSAYVLSWGACVLTAGRCADLFGKRRTFLIGTSLFMLGSALTGIATQAWFLILGRVIQGIGGALFLPAIYTLVFTAFPENKRGFALGVLTLAISIGLAIGPTFGGIVLKLLDWRWIFFLNLPLILPVILIISWAVKREPQRLSNETMDYLGAILVALALIILMYGLNQALNWGITSPKFLITVTGALGLLVIFVLFERYQTHPLIQLDIFRNSIFLGCTLTYAIMGFAFSTVLIVIGQYLENALNYSALNTGFIFLIMTAMFALLSLYGGKLADRIDPRVPIISGGGAMALAFLIFAFCTQHSPLWMPMLALALFGIGVGLGFPALSATMMKSVPPSSLNIASSVFAMFGLMGDTLGLILSSIIIISFGQHHLGQLLVQQNWQITPEQTQLLSDAISATHYNAAQLTGFPAEKIPQLLDALRTAFIHGMTISMVIAMLLAIFSMVISAVLIRDFPITALANKIQQK